MPALNAIYDLHQRTFGGGFIMRRKRMDFGDALSWLKAGEKLARTGWNGKGMWIALQVPDSNSKMGRPYIYMSPIDGQLVPWVASQSCLLADDWEVVRPDSTSQG